MIVVLGGTNGLALKDELHKIIDKFKDEFGDSIESFDELEIANADGLLDAVRSLSFLDPKKLVIVRNFSKSSDVMNRLEEIINQTADSTDLVLIDQSVDKRTAQYKFLQKNTEMRIFNDLSPNDLANWGLDYVRRSSSEISRSAVMYLIDQVGSDQFRIKNELDKLILSNKPITIDLINKMVEPVAQSKIFNLLDVLFKGEDKKAWLLYKDQRAQGEEPQKIIGMITWQLQQLCLAVFAPSKSLNVLVETGMSPYTAQKSLQLAKNISKNDLKYYINQLAETDYKTKTGASVEAAIEVYISDVALRQKKAFI
jgi:DNA polymerase-3 subunit delta